VSEDLTKDSLQKSVKIVGELYPVLTNQDGKILDGSHRIESNPKHYRKIVQTKNRTEEILVRVHAHHRRQVPQEETKAMLVELAKELEKDGIPKENVTAELYKLVPYTEQYVRRLLPEMYKQPEKVEAGRVGAQLTEQKLVSAQLVAQVVKSKVQCPSCLKVFDSGLEYRIHYSHNHPGLAPAPLTQPSNVEEASSTGFEPAPMPEPDDFSLSAHRFSQQVREESKAEPEEEQMACPTCGSLLSPADYELTKTEVGIKFGRSVQQKLFPTEAEA
jgi:hypothetical protein